MKQYYIGQHIVYMKRYWVVVKIFKDKIEVRSLKANKHGWHRMLTLYDDIPTPTSWAIKASEYKNMLNNENLSSFEL